MLKIVKKSNGFTLIEVIVVMGVFLFIIGAAIGIFISVVENQKKVLSEQQLINQVSYIEEYMSKALRMAAADGGACIPVSGKTKYIYLLTRYDNTLESPLFRGIRFFNQSSGYCQEFFIDNTDPSHLILKELKGANGTVVLPENEVAEAVPITSAGLDIKDFRFSINKSNGGTFGSCDGSTTPCGATDDDKLQPRVTMIFTIKVAGDNDNPYRTIQTTVSQRNLNIKDAE